MADYLPAECSNFTERKLGLWGRYLRVAVAGVRDSMSSDCAAEIVGVSPPFTGDPWQENVSTALLRITTIASAADAGSQAQFLRVRVNSTVTGIWGKISAKVLGIDKLGADGGPFFDAVFAQAVRWDDNFAAKGAIADLPTEDTRYADMAVALLSAPQKTAVSELRVGCAERRPWWASG